MFLLTCSIPERRGMYISGRGDNRITMTLNSKRKVEGNEAGRIEPSVRPSVCPSVRTEHETNDME